MDARAAVSRAESSCDGRREARRRITNVAAGSPCPPQDGFEAAVQRLLAGVPPLTDPAVCARVAELLRPYVRERRRAA